MTGSSSSVPLPPDTGPENARLDLLVGANWLMTVRDCDIPFLKAFRDEDRGESFKGKLTPTALCASLLDRHIGTFQVEIGEIQKAADRIDGEVLGARKTRPPLAELAKMRQRVARLRDVLGDHREIIHALLRPDFAAVAGTEEAPFFAALQGHFERTEDGIDRARETVLGSFELYTTRTTQDTNEMVTVLTIVTVMIGAVGAIAGIFGMNFDTAFAHWGGDGFLRRNRRDGRSGRHGSSRGKVEDMDLGIRPLASVWRRDPHLGDYSEPFSAG